MIFLDFQVPKTLVFGGRKSACQICQILGKLCTRQAPLSIPLGEVEGFLTERGAVFKEVFPKSSPAFPQRTLGSSCKELSRITILARMFCPLTEQPLRQQLPHPHDCGRNHRCLQSSGIAPAETCGAQHCFQIFQVEGTQEISCVQGCSQVAAPQPLHLFARVTLWFHYKRDGNSSLTFRTHQ